MVVGFSPLAGQLDEEKKVDYAVAPDAHQDERAATFGVTDYLMAFKKDGNQEAVKAFYDLYYQKEQVNAFIKAEGFLPAVTKSGIEFFKDDPKLKVYLDTLPNAHLTPTDDRLGQGQARRAAEPRHRRGQRRRPEEGPRRPAEAGRERQLTVSDQQSVWWPRVRPRPPPQGPPAARGPGTHRSYAAWPAPHRPRLARSALLWAGPGPPCSSAGW